MSLGHRGHRMVWGMLGATPFLVAAAWAMTGTPAPGSEGGRGPMTARGLYTQAARESEAGDRAATERHLRMALDLVTRPGAAARDRAWELRVRSSLATLVAARGDRASARDIAAPACRMGTEGGPPEGLVASGLCDR